MGRLIDETNLMNLLYALDDARHELFYAIKKIPELPTVEAIPKADYENRLKAEKMFMLDEIRVEIEMEKLEDSPNFCVKAHNNAVDRILQIIDKYRADKEQNE